MIGQWDVGEVDYTMLLQCLEQLRQVGLDRAMLFIEHKAVPTDNPELPLPHDSHMVYWLVCTDPDGKWYWLNDRDDTGWAEVQLMEISTLDILGHRLGLITAW